MSNFSLKSRSSSGSVRIIRDRISREEALVLLERVKHALPAKEDEHLGHRSLSSNLYFFVEEN